MKPTCKLCETRHWTYEAHGSGSEKVRELGESVLGYEKRIPVFPDPNPPESVTTATEGPLVYVSANKRTRGRPRKWASEAERKRAYRGRK